jgi:cytochrome c oxidase subunit 2
VLILAGIVTVVFVKLPEIKDVPSAAAGSALHIRVEGHQYYWQFVYPDGQVSFQRMAVPVGRVVTLDVVSPDVAHSWWVPALGGKIDAIPGRVNHTWFKAETRGSYEARCAELCGLEHAHMTGFVDVVTPDQYRRFLAAHTGPTWTAEATTGRD